MGSENHLSYHNVGLGDFSHAQSIVVWGKMTGFSMSLFVIYQWNFCLLQL
jgi:hypothetical protein